MSPTSYFVQKLQLFQYLLFYFPWYIGAFQHSAISTILTRYLIMKQFLLIMICATLYSVKSPSKYIIVYIISLRSYIMFYDKGKLKSALTASYLAASCQLALAVQQLVCDQLPMHCNGANTANDLYFLSDLVFF